MILSVFTKEVCPLIKWQFPYRTCVYGCVWLRTIFSGGNLARRDRTGKSYFVYYFGKESETSKIPMTLNAFPWYVRSRYFYLKNQLVSLKTDPGQATSCFSKSEN